MRGWIAQWLTRLQQALTPEPATARWIGRAALAGVAAFGVWVGVVDLHLGLGTAVNALAGAGIALAIYGAVRLALPAAVAIANGAVRHLTIAGTTALIAGFMLWGMMGLPPLLALPVAAAGGLAAAGLGAAVGLARRRPAAALLAAVPSVAVLAAGMVWLALDASRDDPTASLDFRPAHDGGVLAQYLAPGPYPVARLTYGSGQDRRRPEFADQVAWTSTPVDGREILGRPSGWRVDLRTRWWGFGPDALPVNGRVWYPEEAPGPLPLVLVVHGNHDMMHFSDPGYAWLGEHLASRGHVVVSVDQNFLNGSIFGGLERENAARAWVLLEHLADWRRWAEEPAHPLHRRADPQRVVLIGHSRGGEAVALAAAFNRLPQLPDNAAVALDYGFDIRGVAAIAPIDGQFRPADRAAPVQGVNYFTIHGGHDADVSWFAGDRVYARARAPAGGIKAALYIHHANHGQFNTVWGDSDAGGTGRYLLNRAALMPGPAQRQAALLYLTAFVEQSLAAEPDWPEHFCDPRAAGQLLPKTVYVARCRQGRRYVLANFADDLDPTTGSADGVNLHARGFARWSENDVGFRANSPRRQTGVWLGWHAHGGDGGGKDPVYSVDLADAAAPAGPGAVLWLDLAQADRDPPKPLDDAGKDEDGRDEDAGEPDENGDDLRPRVRIAVEIEDGAGRRVRRPLTEFADLPPPLPVRHTRLESLDRARFRRPTEPLLQSVAIPLDAFTAIDATLDLSDLRQIRVHFDAGEPGMVVIAGIALQPAGPEPGTPDA